MKSVITLSVLALSFTTSFANENFMRDCSKTILTKRDHSVVQTCYSQEDSSRVWVEVANGGTHLGPRAWELFEVEYSKDSKRCRILNHYREDVNAPQPVHFGPLPNTYKNSDPRYSTRVFINNKRKLIQDLADQNSFEKVECVSDRKNAARSDEMHETITQLSTTLNQKMTNKRDVKVNETQQGKYLQVAGSELTSNIVQAK